ncbi:hypothetical protein [Burkholderia pseudomallei]|uniref:hypothetical protein n=1 Tax=Burkholderia pseudomallei TaxID=28450 RepID=UPI001FBB4BBD|nr:hypothetical protein [Burkholderia pseudomallei]
MKTSARAGARIWRGLFLKVVAAELVTFEHAEGAVVDARRRHDDNPPKTAAFDSSITTRPAPAIPHRKKRECRRSSHLVRHPTYPMPECGATHAPCHAQRPPRRSGRELASHIPPAAAHSRARHRHLAKRPACRCEPVFSVSGRSEMNRLKRILNDQTIRENRASQARTRKENHLDGVPPDKGK